MLKLRKLFNCKFSLNLVLTPSGVCSLQTLTWFWFWTVAVELFLIVAAVNPSGGHERPTNLMLETKPSENREMVY